MTSKLDTAELVERLRNAALHSKPNAAALMQDAAKALASQAAAPDMEPVGFTTPYGLNEVAEGRCGDHVWSAGSLRPDNEVALYSASQLSALQEQVKALQAERSILIETKREQLSALQERTERAEARVEQLENSEEWQHLTMALEAAVARVAELEAALRPFADLGEEAAWMTTKPDDAGAWGFDGATVTWGDFRRARATLAHKGEGRS